MNWQDYIQADAPAYLGINLLKEGYQLDHMHTVVENDTIRQRRIH